MPADASIYSMIRQPTPQPGPMDQYGQVLQMRHIMGQGQLQDLQRQQLERSVADDARVRDLFARGNVKPEEVMAIDPKTGMAYQKNMLESQNAEANMQKTKIETHGAQVKQLRDQLASVSDDAGLARVKEEAFKLYGPQAVASFPPSVNDPNFKTWQEKNIMDANAFLERTKPQYETANLGGVSRVIQKNPNAAGATVGDLTHTQSPDSVATDARAKETLTETKRHHAALEGDPAMIEETAQAIAAGKLAPLSGFALSRPSAQATMSRVIQINPDFDPTQFQTRQKAEKDFGTGKQGNSIRSFNVALSHLDTLDQLSDALNNKDTQLVNKIGNAFAEQTGNPAPTNFVAAKKIVGDEIVKAIVGSGGGVADREEAARTLSSVSSPAQLKGVINTYKDLMRGQIGGLRDQYKSTTGKDDFDTKFLSESGRQVAHPQPKAPVAKTGGIKFLGFEEK